MPFKKINSEYSDPTSWLFVVPSHIIRSGNPPQAIGKERRKGFGLFPVEEKAEELARFSSLAISVRLAFNTY